MGIVFFGTTDTGWHCLDQMVRSGLPISGIVTGLPEFRVPYSTGKLQNLRHRSFESFRKNHGIPLTTYIDAYDETFMATLASWSPRLIVVIGWYHIIPKRVRELAPLGAVGIHWSLLPKYRGGSPLVWAMIHGEKEAGASLFYLGAKIDAGSIVAQEKVAIGEEEDVSAMIEKLNQISGEIAGTHVPRILEGTAGSIDQNEAEATYFPPRTPGDGCIDWSLPARRIYDFVRAQSLPYPCAFTRHQGHIIKIVKATLRPRVSEHVVVRCGDGELLGIETMLVEDATEPQTATGYFGTDEVTF